ncbi:transmembrane amino acid transporter protein-domain-containing protein [Gilbertella persicaria]|uniref:transmembrane amino acid transporter protein-domain-containing protein n=1 Tax=Gilbertella persicaria TaxID=101096 RepID=UPI0022209C78|nr:transmembrane amino acid transporter protein-domain-containing protein [Gilbertella persicaria]KAI8072217.1 transmembrane amino acid transporter protein-domain-containing protein [Gilbertella persicaria]
MTIQESEKISVSPRNSFTQSFKIEETAIDNAIEEDESSVINEFGHGDGSFFTAYFSVVCVVAGTGTLGLPKAFAIGGWLGVLIMFLAYFMSVYSGIILIRCLYYKPGHRLHNYKSVGVAAFGIPGYIIASVLHLLNIFGCPALYMVLASSNLNYLLRNTSGALDLKTWNCIIGAILLIPGLVARTLKEITALSVVAVLSTMIAVFAVAIQGPLERNAKPAGSVITDGVIWTGFPSALATIAFSYGGINTYPHAEHALKKPHQWKWAVFAGLSTCTGLYLLTAVPGYWAYGRETQSPVYNSLENEAARMVAVIVMTVHVILAIPIYTISFSLEFEEWIKCSDEKYGKFGAWAVRSIVRTATMAILVVLAIFVPYFDDFMSLIGALANCGLVFLLPVSCYLKLTGIRNKPWYELAFCALTLFLGIIGCIFGSIDAIKALIRDFNS